MDDKMKNKLAEILDTVKDPESGLPVSQLGLVAGIKHNTAADKLSVYINQYENRKACCMILTSVELAQIEDLIKEALQKEFPHLEVELIHS